MTSAERCISYFAKCKTDEDNYQFLQWITENSKDVNHRNINCEPRFSIITFNDDSKVKLEIKKNLITNITKM